jgi:DNA polymerase-3 subunit epsilon
MKILKPIVFFDIETTGLDIAKDRIVSLATIKISLDGDKEEKQILINPTIPISEEASAVHGITDDMVKDAPTFKQLSKSLLQYFEGCDLAGYNSDYYDLPLLMKEFQRCSIDFPTWEVNLVDVLKFEKTLNSNKLTEVYKRYTGKTLEDAHDSLSDVRATFEVLMHQLNKYDKEDFTPSDIDLFCQGERKRVDLSGKLYLNSKDEVCWAIGKYAHQPIDKDLSYLNWVMQSDFPQETKNKIRNLINNSK